MKRIGWLLMLIVLGLGMASGAHAAQLAWNSKEFMGENEIRPGMIGYGKTVYQGTKIETFGVQVIGVLKKVDFGFDMILVKVTSGPVVTRKLQTVAGMSGSPIYINNRLIGAYAYGWDFQQEPIAGVTPIAAMLDCTQPGSLTPKAKKIAGTLQPANKVLHIGNRLISQVKVAANPSDAARLQAKADPTTMVLTPVSTPIFVSGMSEAALQPLQKLFAQYNLRAMPGPGKMAANTVSNADKLAPGSAVAVSLMEGDANLSAVGTVTYVKGDTVLAFGHPFMGIGKVNMPMSTAYVQGIVNSAASSFKLASPVTRVGTLTSDRDFAVAGIVGQKAKTLPVSMHLSDTTRKLDKYYAVDMVQDPSFTPALLYMYVLSRGASQMADFSSAEGTFTANTVLATDRLGNIAQHMIVSPQASGMMNMPMSEFYLLADSLMLNPYEPVKISKATIDLSYEPQRNIATIEKVTPDRPVARPGETVNLLVRIRPYGKPVETRTVSIKVPRYSAEPVMLVVVAGGTNALMLKSQIFPMPSPEEGIRGIVRWLTNNPTAKSIVSAQLLPSPSYAYRGRMINDLPSPIIDILRFGDTGGSLAQASLSNSGQGDDEGAGGVGSRVRPATYQSSEPMPYILSGGQIVAISIDAPEQRSSMKADGFSMSARVPALSSSLAPDASDSSGSDENSGNGEETEAVIKKTSNWYDAANWFTPVQRNRHAIVFDSFVTVNKANLTPLRIPTFSFASIFGTSFPGLSLSPVSGRAEQPIAISKTQEGTAEPATDTDEDNDSEDTSSDKGSSNDTNKKKDQSLLTQNRPSWGLTTRTDLLRGTQLGTTVTSRGTLVLAPKVRAIYHATEMLPSKMVATDKGIFVSGWNSIQVVRIDENGKDSVIFPQPGVASGAETVTALTADVDGNLLIATWPDQRVRLVKPDGVLLHEWPLPVNMIFNLAVTSDGKRYAACDDSALYQLQDDKATPTRLAVSVPDKDVYALAPGQAGDLYLATAPRGKVYRLSAKGEMTAVYEASDSVSSLAVDKAGNVYVGVSPSCAVYRISPNGIAEKIMTGTGNGNRHVQALTFAGDDLYAATGPAGGIYRISHPAGTDTEVTTILAREDLRNGLDENATAGPESIMVNALAVTSKGDVIAAASTPGQILKLEPRTSGSFISAVLPAPAVAHWGQLDVQFSNSQGAAASNSVLIETRSGSTKWPDATWSAWVPLQGNQFIASPSATNAQIRVTILDSALGHTSVGYLRAYYLPANQAPIAKLQQPTTGIAWSGKKEVKWEGKDPDGDQIVYSLFISADNGQNWKQLTLVSDDKKKNDADSDKPKAETSDKDKKPAAEPEPAKKSPAAEKMAMETTKSSFSWDTTSEKDGSYRMKLVASDRYAKPTNPKSFEVLTGSFIIDNTPPTTMLDKQITGMDALKSFSITDTLTPLVGGKFRFDDGPWTAITADDGIFDSRNEKVSLVSPDGQVKLAPGQHTLDLIAEDAAGNTMNRSITVVIK